MDINSVRVLRHIELERIYLTHPLTIRYDSKVPIKLSDRIVYYIIEKNN